MRTLQVVQKKFESLGLRPEQELFNRTIMGSLINAFLGIALEWIFLFYKAASSQEYMASIYLVNVCSGTFISAICTVINRDKLFSFIDSVNEIFNKRML